jgi:peptide/nickel transport system permease protein
MLGYILSRTSYALARAMAATLVIFLITNLVPGNPVLMQLGDLAASNPVIVAAWEHKYGLDLPLYERYFMFLHGLVHGDLGISISSQRPVLDDIAQYTPATVELAICSFGLSLIIGLSLGIVSAVKSGGWVDHLARLISLVGVAAPTFWLAFIVLAVFYGWLGIAPGGGRLDQIAFPPSRVTGFYLVDTLLAGDWDGFQDTVAHLVLPSAVLAATTLGLITRTTRASMLECLRQDYVRLAHAKGLKHWQVVLHHVWPNALIPVLTLSGLAFANLLTGAVLIETIFSWPGLGRYTFVSASSLDFPATMGITLIVAFTYLAINLIVDISYPFLDPRMRR